MDQHADRRRLKLANHGLDTFEIPGANSEETKPLVIAVHKLTLTFLLYCLDVKERALSGNPDIWIQFAQVWILLSGVVNCYKCETHRTSSRHQTLQLGWVYFSNKFIKPAPSPKAIVGYFFSHRNYLEQKTLPKFRNESLGSFTW